MKETNRAALLMIQFADVAGELARGFSFNRSVGQLYGLLYLSPVPLSLNEIAFRLGMSKGNASVNLRLLETWGAVKSVGMRGSRRDHYEANRDLRGIAYRRLQEGLTKRLALAKELIQRLSGPLQEKEHDQRLQFAKQRLEELRALISKVERVLTSLPDLNVLL